MNKGEVAISNETFQTMTIEDILEMFKNAPRIGSEKDEPEGTRCIQISDTLAKLVIMSIEQDLEDRWQDGIDRMGEDA